MSFKERIRIVGIDGSGKSSILESIKKDLNLPIPNLLVLDGQENKIIQRLTRLQDEGLNKGILSSAILAGKMIYENRIYEPIEIRKKNIEYSLAARDQYVDPLVYGGLYFPNFIKEMSLVNREKILEAIYGPNNIDHYIYLQIRPLTAIIRVMERCKTKNIKLFPHECLGMLMILDEVYLNVLHYMEKEKGKKVNIIDTNNLSIEQVKEQVVKSIVN